MNIAGQLLAQGISAGGQGIAQGITRKYDNEKTAALEAKLEAEKQKAEYDQAMQERDMAKLMAKISGASPETVKAFDIKDRNEISAYIQARKQELVEKEINARVESLKAQTQSAKTADSAMRDQMLDRERKLAQQATFNEEYRRNIGHGMQHQEAFLEAATAAGLLNVNTVSSWGPEKQGLFTREEMGVPIPIPGVDGLFVPITSQSGQIVPIPTDGAAPAQSQYTDADRKHAREQLRLIEDELYSGTAPQRKKYLNEQRARFQSMLPEYARPGGAIPNGNPAPNPGRFQIQKL